MGLNDKLKAAAAAHAGLTWQKGQKVIDNVTALAGVVISGEVKRIVVTQPAGKPARASQGALGLPETAQIEYYTVRLSNGQTVNRSANSLVPVPANVDTELDDFVS